MRPGLLAAAIAIAMGRDPPAPPPPAAGASLANLRLIPVKPGHPREPLPQRFDIDQAQGVCYVREADYPKLKAALARRKAAQADPAPANGPAEG